MYVLVMGSKSYSSWSIRARLAMKQAELWPANPAQRARSISRARTRPAPNPFQL